MKKEEIYNCIENLCKLYNIENAKKSENTGYYLKEPYHGLSKKCWSWYGEKTGKLRIDYCFDAEKTLREKAIAEFNKNGYEVIVPRSTSHIFFVRDEPIESITTNRLNEAMQKYKKFIIEDLPKIESILEK